MKAFRLRMSDELHERLSNFAHARRNSMNAEICRAIAEYLERHQAATVAPRGRHERPAADD